MNMRLLFDQNLSPNLVVALSNGFPGSVHVQDAELARSSDSTIWEFARENDFTIVTKDADFHDRRVLTGGPPNVVWIRRGNCSTAEIEALLSKHRNAIMNIDENHQGCLIIS